MLLPNVLRPLLALFLGSVTLGAAWGWAGQTSSAQAVPPGRTPFRSYGPEEGLSNQAITRLAQDELGFLWVATQSHLFRFDGREFKAFGVTDGLPSDSITALAPAASGGLWVGTFRGLARLRQGRFLLVPGGMGTVFQIVTRGPDVWLATSHGLFKGRDGEAFQRLEGWEGEAHAVWAPAGNDEVWAAGHGRLRCFTAGGGWREIALPGRPEAIHDLAGGGAGQLFIRTATRLLGLEGGRIRDLQAPAIGNPSDDARMTVDGAGRVWLPTNAGLQVFEQGRWWSLTQAQGMPDANPVHVLFDQEGSLWVGGQGVHRQLGLGRWRTFTEREGLPHPTIWGIRREASGTLWVVTGGGIGWARGRGWEDVPGTRGQRFRGIAFRRAGGIWTCPQEGGVLGVSAAGERTMLTDGLPLVPGLSVLEDRFGRLWLGTRQAGLFVRETGERRFHPVALPSGTDRERIGALAEGADGSIWVAGEQGLARLQPGAAWRRFRRADGLRLDHVEGVLCTRRGQVVIRYFEPTGLSRLAVNGGAVQVLDHLDASTGLGTDKVYFLGEDAEDRLWVGTGMGLDLVGEGRIDHYGVREGLAGEDCNAGAFWVESDGRVWVGTSTGLSSGFGRWGMPPPPPRTVLVSAEISKIPLPVAGATVPELAHEAEDLVVQFTTPTFRRQEEVVTRYRLYGWGGSWKETRSREIQVNGLTHGLHTLVIQSRRRNGDWGEEARLAFRIRPAWWEPWWVKVLGGLALGSGLFVVVRLEVKRLRRRNQELQSLLTLSERLTHDLEEANLALLRQSTTDPLTGLRNRRYLQAGLEEDLAFVDRAYHAAYESGASAPPSNADLAFLIADIDHFKQVNDTYGHLAGDAVLQQFAEILRSATRGSDTLVRWGGEEFLVEARHSQRRDMPVLAERIRRNTESWPFQLPDGTRIQCTCSIGFAAYPFTTDTPLAWEDVVALADQCLYRAKNAGRNRWVGYTTWDLSQGEALSSHPAEADVPVQEG